MHLNLKTPLARTFSSPGPIVVVACIVAITVSLPVCAELTDEAFPWPLESDWTPYTVDGDPVYDSEGGLSTDSSNGGASFSSDSDIASGWDMTSGPCTFQGPPPDTQCGTKVSGFFYYTDGGTVGDLSDDVVYGRMRIDGDPRGTSARGFKQNHWNFLLDVEMPDIPVVSPGGESPPDRIKELWIDVFGGFNGGNDADQLRILFENNNDNDVTNDNGAGGTTGCGGSSTAGGTFINSFIACNDEGLGGECQNASGNDLSHTRVIAVSTIDPLDISGEFYIDVQVPVMALTDNTGCYSGPTKFTDTEDWETGNVIVQDPSDFAMLYSTSNSNTDPMQKDWVDDDFGDVFTTPVTLASFSAQGNGAVVRFEWTTATETANVGFDIYVLNGDRWQRVNERLIPSKAVNSTTPQHYSFEADVSTGSLFKIVDISTDIRSRNHGPFELDRAYGRPATAVRVDWPAIRYEHVAKVGARQGPAAAAAKKSLAVGAAEVDIKKGFSASKRQSPVCDLEVSETGLYRVTASELAESGCSLEGVRPRFVGMTNRGQSVPIRVMAPGRTFGPGSFIEFYGEAEDSFYTRKNVYQLLIAPGFGKRVKVDRRLPAAQNEAPAAYTESLLVDDNRAYHFMSPTGDPWYDTRLLANADEPLTVDFPLQVDHLGEGAATLHVGLWGVTNWPDNPDHHVQVLLNGSLLRDEYFDGLINVPLSIELPQGLLHDGENTLSLVLPGDTGVRFDMVNLDTYGVDYPRAFVARDDRLAFEANAKVLEVGGLHADELVVYRMSESKTGGELWFLKEAQISSSSGDFTARFAGDAGGEAKYLVATVNSLLTPMIVPPRAKVDIVSGSAEYLVISHPDFLDGLGPLVAEREAQGWQVRVVDVDDVFARFGFGIFDPQAIRDYVAYGVANMGTRAVLLVGGDTLDYLDYLGVGSLSFIPTVYTNTGSGATFTPTDALLADGDGDLVPDVAIGRLPVRTSAELAAIVAKILAYETGGHRYTAVFAADDSEPGTPFTETSSELIDELPGSWHVTRAHIDESGEAGARAALLAALDGGVALTSFIGHSGPDRWTFDGLFASEDVGLLNNVGAPTVVSQWGCWNTYFVEPEVDTMAHAFMLGEGGGAAAVLGAATVTTFREDDAFAPLLQRHLTMPGKPIGEAILDAKRDLAEIHPGMLEVILGLNLLGDPALVVAP